MLVRGIVAKSERGSDRVRRAPDRVESFQMAPLSWLHHSLVRAVVSEVSDLICAYGRDGARARADTALEILALRQQVAVLKRTRPRPPLRLRPESSGPLCVVSGPAGPMCA